MSSLVLELQSDAMSSSIRVSDLLRKALAVAIKLNIPNFTEFVKNELNGYKGGDLPPEYRRIKGEVKVFNPYHGWQPVLFPDLKIAELISKIHIYQPISELEDLIKSKPNVDVLAAPFPQNILNKLVKSEFDLLPTRVVSSSEICGILDAVRNIVLDWSLKLEQDGILGEGMTFTDKEKKIASTITYIENFKGIFGDVKADSVQIGDSNSIIQELKRLGVPQKEQQEFEDILDSIKTANKNDKPSIVKRGMEWIQRNAETIGPIIKTIRTVLGIESQ